MAEERLEPSAVARHTFDTARRGFDRNAVRAYLHEVSQALTRLQRGEQELRERAERAEARLALAEQPDEAFLMEVLGEETTRVLTSARESAVDIRSKAEQSAARLISDAQAEASRLRRDADADIQQVRSAANAEADRLLEEARGELARRQAEAAEAAAKIIEDAEAVAAGLREEAEAERIRAQEETEAEVEASRQRGREMVAEAQAVRERILRDLTGRRRKTRQQVERLDAGRERLLQAYEVVRRTIDEATSELTVSVSEARAAADAAARRVDDEADPTMEEIEAEIDAVRRSGPPLVAPSQPDEAPDAGSGVPPGATPGEVADELLAGPVGGAPDAADQPEAGSQPEQASAVVVDAERATEAPPERDANVTRGPSRRSRRRRRRPDPAAETAAGGPDAPLVALQGGEELEAVRVIDEPADAEVVEATTEPDPAAEPAEEQGDDGAAGLFARLRAEREGTLAEARATLAATELETAASDVDDEGSEPVDEADAEHDPQWEPEEATEGGAETGPFAERDEAVAPVARELLKRLKRVLADEQNEVLDLLRRTKPAGADDLVGSAAEHAKRWVDAAGSALSDAAAAGAASIDGKGSDTGTVPTQLGEAVVAPLRERIERIFGASDGDLEVVSERVRALYREWKGQHLADAAAHHARAAFDAGRFAAVPGGTKVRWLVGGTEPCPDCADNGLGGALTKGEPFPTGHPAPPAHPGCGCLLIPDE